MRGGGEFYLSAGTPTDFDQHYETGRQGFRWLPSYEYDEVNRRIEVVDPVWGEETIGDWEGDEIFFELYMHPVFQRLAAIEQLTLPKRYATMPGTTDFTRWEHAWGSVVLARKLLREAEDRGVEYAPREKLIFQLRTFVSDAGQWAFSHLGDWLKQEFGGPEDGHDEDLPDYLELTGVNDVLRRHDIQPEEIIFPPDTQDWVECNAPDLCLDRVDYGSREMTRWVTATQPDLWRHAFMIDDKQQLIMRNKLHAKAFGSAFGLLATEHWSHPVHRLQLQFFAELIKNAVTGDVPLLRGGSQMHPIDILRTIDDDLLAVTRQIGPLNNDLHALMLDLGRAQRRIFAWGREHVVYDFMGSLRYGNGSAVFPDPLETTMWQTEYAGAHPQNIELIAVEETNDEAAGKGRGFRGVEDFDMLPHTLDVFLPALKPRAVDPRYVDDDGEVRRLSETDADFAANLKRHQALQGQAMVARMYLAPPAVAAIKRQIAEVRAEWQRRMVAPRTEASKQALAEAMADIGMLAIGGHSQYIRYTY